MSSFKFEIIYKLLSDHNFNLNDVINPRIICRICSKIMIDPYIASCGCHFCCQCIRSYINEGKKFCLCEGEESREEAADIKNDIVVDIVGRRGISNMVLKCPNETCSVMVKLQEMAEHLGICTVKSIFCPYDVIGCTSAQIKEENRNDHMYNEAFLHAHLLIEAINNLKNDVYGLKEVGDAREKELSILKDVVERNKEEMINVVKENHENEVIMKNEIIRLHTELNSMKTEMEKVKIKREDKSFDNRVNMNENILKSTDLESFRTKIELIEIKLETREKEIEINKTHIERRKIEIAISNKEIETIKLKMEAMKTEIEINKTKNEIIKTVLDPIKMEVEILRTVIETLKVELKTKNLEMETKKIEIISLNNKLDLLKSGIEILQTEINQFKAKTVNS